VEGDARGRREGWVEVEVEVGDDGGRRRRARGARGAADAADAADDERDGGRRRRRGWCRGGRANANVSVLFHGIGVRDAHRTVRVRGVATIRARKVSAAVVEGELSHARAEGDDVSRVSRQVLVRIVENRSTQGRSRVVLASSEGSIERVLARVVSERGERALAPTRRAITEKLEQRGESRPSRRAQ